MRPSQAASAAKDGDVIEIAAGLYTGDVAVWRANDLTIRGAGGRARLDAAGKNAEGKAIWVIKGKNTTVEHIEFFGCKVPDKNGAGIRQEGPGLVARDCYFHHNEDGILTGAHPESDIRLEGCEFSHNGFGDGLSHNIYIGRVRSFTLVNSYSHHALIGHLVKSRAEANYILYNRLMDEADGRSSYLVNLPNGGKSFLIGNVLMQGPLAENSVAMSYAEEGAKNAVQEFYVVHNTFVNARQPGRFVRVAGTPAVKVINNLVAGTETVLIGNGELLGNALADKPGFVDAAKYDYHLTAASPAINAGVAPGKAGDFSLAPKFEYKHPLQKVACPASDKLDAGAYQYDEALKVGR